MALSPNQVAAIKYKEAFGKKPRKIDETRNEFRFRQRPPGAFQRTSFRRVDIGKKGGFEAVVGRPHGTTKTRIQSIILPKIQIKGRLR